VAGLVAGPAAVAARLRDRQRPRRGPAVFGEMPVKPAGVVSEHGLPALFPRFGGFLSHVIGLATSPGPCGGSLPIPRPLSLACSSVLDSQFPASSAARAVPQDGGQAATGLTWCHYG